MNTATCIEPRDLPVAVCEQILVHAIRTNTNPQDPFMKPAPIVACLNVLPDSPTRDLRRAAIMQMWWIDCDWASAHGHVFLLDLLLKMAEHRPLQYSSHGLFAAIENCHLDVVEWWLSQARKYQGAQGCPLYIEWFLTIEDDHFRKSVRSALASGNRKAVDVFRWFVESVLEWGPIERAWESRDEMDLSDLFLSAIKHSQWPVLSIFFGQESSKATRLAAECLAKWTLSRSYSPSCAQSDAAFVHAVGTGNVVFARHLFEMLIKHNSCVPYDQCAKAALEGGHLQVIEWMVSEYDLYVDWILMAQQAEIGPQSLHVIDWALDRFGLAPERVGTLLELAAKYGATAWFEAAYEVDPECVSFKLPAASLLLQAATDCAQVQVLEWWQEKDLPLCDESTDYDVDAACMREDSIGVLDWWVHKSGLPCFRYSDKALFNASMNGCVTVLEWWKSKSGLSLILPSQANFLLVTNHFESDKLDGRDRSRDKVRRWAAMKRWWMQSGLLSLDQFEVKTAAWAGDVMLLDYLLKCRACGSDNNTFWTLRTAACAHNSVHVVEYLFKRRGESFAKHVVEMVLCER